MKIKIGLATIVGYVTLLIGAIPLVTKTVQEGAAIHLNKPEAALALLGVVMGGITSLGRYLQAHAVAGQIGSEVDTPAPEFAALPTTSATDIPADVGDKGSA